MIRRTGITVFAGELGGACLAVLTRPVVRTGIAIVAGELLGADFAVVAGPEVRTDAYTRFGVATVPVFLDGADSRTAIAIHKVSVITRLRLLNRPIAREWSPTTINSVGTIQTRALCSCVVALAE